MSGLVAGTNLCSTSLNGLLSVAGLEPLDPDLLKKFDIYLTLILRWNARINLTAVRNPEGILVRHFVESIAAALALPRGIATLLDFGSGAGLPGIPIAICCPELSVTLAESQNRKAAFLREAIRTLGLDLHVVSGRAENLESRFDCVTMRAVDRMGQAVPTAARLVAPAGWLALMTTTGDLGSLQQKWSSEFLWAAPVRLPGSEHRVLALGHRTP